MVGTRDRSRNRGMDSRDQYELQDMQTSHRTGEGSTIDYENSHDDGDHGHPQNPGAQRLDRRIPGMCKERVAGALRTCKTQTVAVLRMCMVGLAKHRMMTLCIVSIIGFLVVWAFRVLKFSAKPPDYELEWSTEGATEHYLSTTTVRGSATLYRTITVQDVQFYGGRPVHHQAPITVAPNHERTGHVISRDSSYPLIGTGTSTSVSGLYYMPMSLTNEDWLQTQDSHLASNLVSNVQGSQCGQGNPNRGNLGSDTKLPLQLHEMGAPRNLFAGQADADRASSTRWGEEIVYTWCRRSRRSPHFDKGWCIENACSPHEQISSKCKNANITSGYPQKQESEWRWPENQRKHQAIDKHYTEVSRRVLYAILIICGIFLSCTLLVGILLAMRTLRHRGNAKADLDPHKHATTVSTLQEKKERISSHQSLHSKSRFDRASKAPMGRNDDKAIENRSTGDISSLSPWYKIIFAKSEKRSGLAPLQKQNFKPHDQEIVIREGDSHEWIPVLPPAAPVIRFQVYSDVEDIGQGRLLSDARTNSSKYDVQGMPCRSLRQSRAVSSGSEHCSPEATHRREAAANV